MSGNHKNEPHDGDRRQRRTRDAIFSAFRGLIVGHRRRYAEVRVDDIVAGAAIGRSTFYEHYKSKDDMLLASMTDMLDVLAGAVTDQPDMPHLEELLAHFVDVRPFAREVLWGPTSQHTAPRVTRELARRVEAHLRQRGATRSCSPIIPLELMAAQIAEAQLALVRAWLSGDSKAEPASVAEAMCRSARSTALALLA